MPESFSVLATLPFLHIALAILALRWLRNRKIEEVAQAIWVLIIVAIPILGSVALAIVQPGAAPAAKPKFELNEFRQQ